MKVIFLDIDGVLNTSIYSQHYFAIAKLRGLSHEQAKVLAKKEIRDEFGILFDPFAVNCLRWIIDRTKAKIVISSTWRYSGLNQMQLMWEMRNLPGEVIDITPNYSEIAGTCRGDEIADYCKENSIDSYIILDDMPDMLPHQINNFVMLDPHYGITRKDVELCVKILNQNE